MAESTRLDDTQLTAELEKIADSIRAIAAQCEGEPLQLLALLRTLESLHQEVRDTRFQRSLPDNRQAFHSLLRDIETNGGWPYIHRMRLQALMQHLQVLSDEDLMSIASENAPQK